MVYGTNERVIFTLDEYDTKLSILNGIAVPYFTGGSTNTAGALRAIRTVVFTPENVCTGASRLIRKLTPSSFELRATFLAFCTKTFAETFAQLCLKRSFFNSSANSH